jgi:hypothetical protein
MNRIEAAPIAEGYALPEIAALLIEAATEGEGEELQVRARESLLQLDRDFFEWRPRAGLLRRLVPEPAPSPSVDGFAIAMGTVLAKAIRSGDRRERQRLGRIVAEVLAEAQRIGREAEQEAA